MKRRQAGFTLIEILVVITIIGILTAVAVPSYQRYIRQLAVNQATEELSRTFDKARDQTRRFNTCQEVVFKSSTEYELRRYPTTRCTGTSVNRTFTMMKGTVLGVTGSVVGVAYQPPYGTSAGLPVEYTVTSSVDSTMKRTLRVTGVMGKVIVK